MRSIIIGYLCIALYGCGPSSEPTRTTHENAPPLAKGSDKALLTAKDLGYDAEEFSVYVDGFYYGLREMYYGYFPNMQFDETDRRAVIWKRGLDDGQDFAVKHKLCGIGKPVSP